MKIIASKLIVIFCMSAVVTYAFHICHQLAVKSDNYGGYTVGVMVLFLMYIIAVNVALKDEIRY